MADLLNQVETQSQSAGMDKSEDSLITHAMMLNAQKLQIEQSREEAKRKRDWEEMQKCTFKPTTLPKKQPKTASLNLVQDKKETLEEEKFAGYEAAQRLYAKRKPQREKTEKTKEEYEFEKYGDECTFAPKMYTKGTGVSKQTKQSEREQQQFNKQLERQKKAREEKERIKQLKERGVPASTLTYKPRQRAP